MQTQCIACDLSRGVASDTFDSSPVSQTGEEIGLEKAHHAKLIKHNISFYINKPPDS
jgi:hypothetical protein